MRSGVAKRAASASRANSLLAASTNSSSSEPSARSGGGLSTPGGGSISGGCGVGGSSLGGSRFTGSPSGGCIGFGSPSGGVPGGGFPSPSIIKAHSFRRGRQERVGAVEVDLALRIGLVNADQLQPGHLQEREERRHHAVPLDGGQVGEERAERQPLGIPQPVADGRDAVADGEALDEN